ncbi:unnamed protein product [Sphagnum jensenii]|uniref:Fungal lipase-type domain-containing protein n=1 Tax=Sphagnum jensenii TaxID=128206 RepID=A0ABP0VWI1_9BRYO
MATTPPVMRSASSTNYKFRKEDLSRAIFCAQVVSHEDDDGAQKFLEESQQTHPGIQFDKIHMSLDYGDKAQKFLVAYANDATFIAFRGTKTLKDVTDTFQFDENCKRYFHKGFLKRSDVFNAGTGPHVPIFELLSKSERRIILCGHGVGGAVSHMILLRFLLYHGESNHIKDHPNSIISIAFGAPHVCDQNVAEEVNINSNFKERFINFVNEADPVPRLLHNLRRTVAAGLRAQGTELFNTPDAKSWKNLADHLTSNDTKETNPPKFHPIGQYAFLGTGPPVRVLPAGGDIVGARLQQLDFSHGNLKYHTATSYETALVNANLIDNPSFPISSESRPFPTITRPGPEVKDKKFRAIDAGGRCVILQGRNLSFLRKTVTLNGIECDIIHQSDSELCVMDPLGQGPSNAMIWTWFGQIPVPISENGEATTDPDSAANLFPKIVQTWVLMAKVLPRNGGDSWEKHQVRLDNIVQCVNERVPKIKLSSHLKEIGCGEGDISEHIKDAVNMGNEVKKFMQTSLQIDYKATFTLDKGIKLSAHPFSTGFAAMGAPHFAGTAGTAGTVVAAGTAAAAAALPIVGWILIGIGLATFLGGVAYAVYKTVKGYHKLINSTDAVLDLAIKEVLRWQCSATHKGNSTEAVSKEKKLELLVDKAPDQFKTWVETLHSTHNSEIQLKSDEFEEATPESMFRFLKRIKIVTESRSIYRDTVEGKCFVGILGAEDIGKSTFIRRALVRNKSPGPLPKVGMGMNDHTKIPQLYQAEKNLWLVDFPGGNSVEDYGDYWQHFSALPSFVVLLLEFKGDLKQDQKDMYKKMRAALNTDFIVAFNKVDTISPDNYKKKLTIREYFKAQREKTSKALDCHEDKIHYLCLNPDRELPGRFKKLKEQGVLGFEDFYGKVLDNVNKWQLQSL